MYLVFVKQKTAYELRISDWSSDVCSSDLALDRGAPRGAQAGGIGETRHAGRQPLQRHAEHRDAAAVVAGRDPRQVGAAHLQNGNASCREKGCPDVEIPRFAVPLQKNTIKRQSIHHTRTTTSYPPTE